MVHGPLLRDAEIHGSRGWQLWVALSSLSGMLPVFSLVLREAEDFLSRVMAELDLWILLLLQLIFECYAGNLHLFLISLSL